MCADELDVECGGKKEKKSHPEFWPKQLKKGFIFYEEVEDRCRLS